MKKTAISLLPIVAGLLLSAGSLPASAASTTPATEPLTILKPNLKVVSSLSAPYTDLMTGHRVLALAFSIQNTGWLPAPATTTTLTLEAGDPFSPISTAIGVQSFNTPTLAAGASTPAKVIILEEAVYLRVDIRADAGNVVNESTKADNHRVHTSGYLP
jgi:hypothetical protein